MTRPEDDNQLTDDEALTVYARTMEAPGYEIRGSLYDDDDRRDAVRIIRGMVAAETDEAALRIIDEWRNPMNTLAVAREVRAEAARMLAGRAPQPGI